MNILIQEKKCYRRVKETHNVWQTGMGKIVRQRTLFDFLQNMYNYFMYVIPLKYSNYICQW